MLCSQFLVKCVECTKMTGLNKFGSVFSLFALKKHRPTTLIWMDVFLCDVALFSFVSHFFFFVFIFLTSHVSWIIIKSFYIKFNGCFCPYKSFHCFWIRFLSNTAQQHNDENNNWIKMHLFERIKYGRLMSQMFEFQFIDCVLNKEFGKISFETVIVWFWRINLDAHSMSEWYGNFFKCYRSIRSRMKMIQFFF